MSDTPVWDKSNTTTTVPAVDQRVTRPWARFVAKQADFALLFLPVTIFNLFFMPTEFDAEAMAEFYSPTGLLNTYILWPLAYAVSFLVVEALVIAQFGTTPGKWIMGIRLCDSEDGENPSLMTSLQRSFWSMLRGQGMTIQVLWVIAGILAYNRLTKHGATSWDEGAGVVYQTTSVNPLNWIVTIGLLLGLSFGMGVYFALSTM